MSGEKAVRKTRWMLVGTIDDQFRVGSVRREFDEIFVGAKYLLRSIRVDRWDESVGQVLEDAGRKGEFNQKGPSHRTLSQNPLRREASCRGPQGTP